MVAGLRQRWTGLAGLPAAVGLGGLIGLLGAASSSALVPLAAVAGAILTSLLFFHSEVAILTILFIRPLLDLLPPGASVPGFAKEFGPSEAVAFLLAVGGILLILVRRIDPFRIPLVLPFAALVLAGAASFSASANPQLTAIALLRLVGQLSLYVLVYSYLRERKQLDRLLLVIILSALPPVLWGFGQILAGHGHFFRPGIAEGITAPRLAGPFGTGLTVGIFLVAPTALALVTAMESREPVRKLTFFAVAGFMLFALYFTFARSAWLAMGIAVAIPAVVRYRTWLWAAPVVLLLMIIVLPGIRQRWEPVFTNTGDTTVAGRVGRWGGALDVFVSHPVLGAGLGVGDVEAGLEAAGKPSPTHGDYFRVLADTGVMGLAAFLWLLGAVGGGAIRAYRGAVDPHYRAIALVFFAIWAAFLVMRATGNILTHQVFQYDFWALAAATLAITKVERRPRGGG